MNTEKILDKIDDVADAILEVGNGLKAKGMLDGKAGTMISLALSSVGVVQRVVGAISDLLDDDVDEQERHERTQARFDASQARNRQRLIELGFTEA